MRVPSKTMTLFKGLRCSIGTCICLTVIYKWFYLTHLMTCLERTINKYPNKSSYFWITNCTSWNQKMVLLLCHVVYSPFLTQQRCTGIGLFACLLQRILLKMFYCTTKLLSQTSISSDVTNLFKKDVDKAKENNIRYCSKANKNVLSFFSREKNEWNFFSRLRRIRSAWKDFLVLSPSKPST